MYRIIKSSKVTASSVEFNDVLTLDVDLPDIQPIQVAASGSSVKFPGRDQFLEDALHILEDEYHFDVIGDVYEENKELKVNKLSKTNPARKGHISNRPSSDSIYFDTYYDLNNAEEPLKRMGISDRSIPQNVTVQCYIHFRFSDHDLFDMGDVDHLEYLEENTKKYTEGKDLLLKIREETISVPEAELYSAYDDALDTIRYELDSKIYSWVQRARKIAQKRQ